MKPVRVLLSLLLFSAVAAFSQTVFAHTDEYLDTLKAPNGGQLRMSGIYHFELVVAKDNKLARESPVAVYVTDHAGTRISTVGAGGTATLVAGKRKLVVKLVPDGVNGLKGLASYASTPDMKVVVAITLSDKTVRQARFTPLAVAKDGPGEQKH